MPKQPSRRFSRRQEPSNAPLWWAVGGGVAVLLLVIVGGVAALLILTAGSSEFPDAPPNPNVTAESFDRLRYGNSFARVKQTLGSGGRPLTDADLDVMCHRRSVSWVNMREPWKRRNERGEMRVWESGRLRILLQFHRPPEEDGHVIGLVIFHPDGRSGGQISETMPSEQTIKLWKDQDLKGG